MYNSLNLDGYIINDVNSFEYWLRDKHNFDKHDCAYIVELYDEELGASENLGLYQDIDSEFIWYQERVNSVRNDIMCIVDDMRERLTGKQSQQELQEIYDLLESL